MVVFASSRPDNSRIVRISQPLSNGCVAKECRNAWRMARSVNPALPTVRRTRNTCRNGSNHLGLALFRGKLPRSPRGNHSRNGYGSFAVLSSQKTNESSRLPNPAPPVTPVPPNTAPPPETSPSPAPPPPSEIRPGPLPGDPPEFPTIRRSRPPCLPNPPRKIEIWSSASSANSSNSAGFSRISRNRPKNYMHFVRFAAALIWLR
jgi:hypothetical protein